MKDTILNIAIIIFGTIVLAITIMADSIPQLDKNDLITLHVMMAGMFVIFILPNWINKQKEDDWNELTDEQKEHIHHTLEVKRYFASDVDNLMEKSSIRNKDYNYNNDFYQMAVGLRLRMASQGWCPPELQSSYRKMIQFIEGYESE